MPSCVVQSDRNTWLRAQLLARFPLRPHQSGYALGRCVCDFVFVKHETLRARSISEGDYEEAQREEGAMRRGENVREVWKRPSVCRNHLAKVRNSPFSSLLSSPLLFFSFPFFSISILT